MPRSTVSDLMAFLAVACELDFQTKAPGWFVLALALAVDQLAIADRSGRFRTTDSHAKSSLPAI
ncbi:hypothetical protein GA0061105_101221 [Rhizobium aethiopicum]|uniref:Uncharacterized protein n=2 Tax=Rhizobium aethiopicum TaxID=1138170 RepID=A0A1C3XVX1_9HYPH|nr:hypothetical protein GA0061105_101221 [Rhizobium aethiopicum]